MSLNSYIAKQFSRPTGFGGKLVSSIMNWQNRSLYEETIRLLSLSDTDSVLDIGCGNGTVLNMLARRYDCKFTGIDISASIIKAASERNYGFVENGRMRLMCQDISGTSFVDCSFDKVYTINTLYFLEDLDNTMTEIYRVLKPNGLFINAFYSNETLSRLPHTEFNYKKFTTEQLTNAGENAGFSVNVVPILNGTAHCVFYRKTGVSSCSHDPQS